MTIPIELAAFAAIASTAVGMTTMHLVRRLQLLQAVSSHDRCADALATLRARVDRALAAETPGAAPAAKRLCRILRGEE